MTFVTPVFLFAALAGLIPVLLHLLNRQQAPVLPFSTLRFLQLSVQRTRRRKYLHDLLLLALRIAALVIIAVGLAQPTIAWLGKLIGRKADSAVVLILDNSASMGAKDVTGQRWEAARKGAEYLLNQLSDSDSAALLLTCGPLRPELNRLHADLDVVRSALDEAHCQSERADLAARITEADRLLAEVQVPHKEIYVISDMQAASWQSLPTSLDDASQRPPIVLVDVHAEPEPNAGISQLAVHSAGPVVGIPWQVTVRVAGDSFSEQQRHVELVLDDQPLEMSSTLKLAVGGTADAAFGFKVDRPGVHRGLVRLVGNDANPLDDQRHFAVNVEPRISVAVVQADRHPIPYLEDAYYLERALAPVSDPGWAIEVTSLAAEELGREPLTRYAAIYCVNIPAPDAGTARRLLDYVRQGGHLVWTCGDRVDPVDYAGMNSAAQDDLLPLPLGSVRAAGLDQPDGWQISSLDATHEALAALTEPESLYRTVLVSKHLELLPVAGRHARVLATLNDGQPLFVERQVGAGSVCMWGSSVHVDWCNLPLRPLFLPLFARLTFHFASTQSTPPQIVAGVPLVIPVSQPGGGQVEIGLPTGETVRLAANGKENAIRHGATHEVGIYQVKTLGTPPRQFGVAANLDPEELASLFSPAESIGSRFGNRPWLACPGVTELANAIHRLREGDSIMEPLLFAVLFALIAEAGVANWRVAREPQETPLGTVRIVGRQLLPEKLELPRIGGGAEGDRA